MLIRPVIVALAAAAISSAAGGRGGVEGPTYSGSGGLAVSERRQSNSAAAAYLVCYENSAWSGDEVRLREYAPYLSLYNFNNRARSCCVNGM